MTQTKPKETVNVAIETGLRDKLKIIAIENGCKLNELTAKVLSRFTRDYSKKRTVYSLLESDNVKA